MYSLGKAADGTDEEKSTVYNGALCHSRHRGERSSGPYNRWACWFHCHCCRAYVNRRGDLGTGGRDVPGQGICGRHKLTCDGQLLRVLRTVRNAGRSGSR